MQIPGGILAERFGGKWIFGIGSILTALFTLLTPVCANAGKGYLIANRILMGLSEGVTFPVMHSMIARWIPPTERSRLGALIWAGELDKWVLRRLEKVSKKTRTVPTNKELEWTKF